MSAFPTSTGNTTTSAALTSPFNINLPAGIVAGDILVVGVTRAGGTQTFTFPGGWTVAWQADSVGTVVHAGWAWRVALGTEGATISVSSTVATSQATESIAEKYSGGLSVEAGTAVMATSATPDPPSLTPSWGADNTLFLAVYGTANNTSVTSYPANYTGDQFSIVVGPSMATCSRQLNAASDNPGTFTIAASSGHVVNTMAIRPAASLTAVGRTTPYLFGPNRGPSKGMRPQPAYPRLPYTWTITGATGAYAVAGVAATPNKGFGFVAAAGAYVLGGVAAGLTVARRIAVTAGTYVYTGVAATIGKGFGLAAAAGAYVLSGKTITFPSARHLVAAAGTYVYTGVAATVARGLHLVAAAGSYAISGVAATFTRSLHLLAGAGAYILTGFDLLTATLPFAQVAISYLRQRKIAAGLQKSRQVAPALQALHTPPSLARARQNFPSLYIARSAAFVLQKLRGPRSLGD